MFYTLYPQIALANQHNENGSPYAQPNRGLYTTAIAPYAQRLATHTLWQIAFFPTFPTAYYYDYYLYKELIQRRLPK
jgi:hypothetical protein